jgi:hypothetical protein
MGKNLELELKHTHAQLPEPYHRFSRKRTQNYQQPKKKKRKKTASTQPVQIDFLVNTLLYPLGTQPYALK